MNASPPPLPPTDSQHDDEPLGAKLKTRLAIAISLIVIALAIIPLLDNLSRHPLDDSDVSSRSGTIIQTTDKYTAASQSSTEVNRPQTAPPLPELNHPSSAPTSHNISPRPLPIDAENISTAMSAPPPSAFPRALIPKASQRLSQEQTILPPPLKKTPFAPPVNLTPPRLVKSVGYHIQLGLFNNMENAHKLMAELKQKGITAQTETRVHLPVVRTRVEAEEIMARLRTLGYTPLLTPAEHK